MNPLLPYDLPLDGAHLIEASAGTGKTFTIATLVLRLVLEAGRTIDEILVVTFTRAATAELRDRIRRRLAEALTLCAPSAPPDADPTGLAAHLARRRAAGHGPADVQALTAALRSFDTAPIFTIHGFCQRVLQEFAFESGMSFEATLAEDSLALQREIVADYWATRTYAAPRSLVDYLIHQAKVTPTTLDTLADAVARGRGIELTPAPASGDGAVDPADLARSVAAWHAARAAVAEALDAGRVGAEAILGHSPALRHGSLTRANVPRWLDQVDAWTRGQATPPSAGAIRDKWVRFTSDAVAEATKDGHETPHHPFFVAVDRLRDVDDILGEAMARWADGVRLDLLPYLRRETDLRRRRANAQTFDDLLHDLAAALEGDRGRRLTALAGRRYKAALIDEFQDTDDVQYRIIRALFGAGSVQGEPAADEEGEPAVRRASPYLAFIGDPKQAIYSFRGADVQTYLKAAADVGPERSWTLDTNHRADRGLIAAVNAVWSAARIDRPFVHPEIRFHPVQARHDDRLHGVGAPAMPASPASPAPLTILTLDPEDAQGEIGRDGLIQLEWALRAIPRRVAADIAALLATPPRIRVDDGGPAGDAAGDAAGDVESTRPLAPGDIAVLTRTNGQSEAVHQALLRLGLPSVRQGEASVFDTEEAESLGRILAAVLEPGDGRRVRAALATPLLGADAARLVTLSGDEAAWETEVEIFRAWQERWRRSGFIQAFRRIVDDADIALRCLALPDGERRLTNVLHLGELLHRAAHDEGHGPSALLAWLTRMRTDAAARTAAVGDSAQLRLERDGMAIQVVTIHRSKGLEYPVVYCPYLWYHRDQRRDDGAPIRFNDPAVGRPRLDVGAKSHPDRAAHAALAEVDAFAEDLRLAYVALTRAKHHCAVVWGPISGAAKSALGRLIHPLLVPSPTSATAAVDAIAAGDAREAIADADDATVRPPDMDDAVDDPHRWLETIRSHVQRRLADPRTLADDLADLVRACPDGIARRPLTAHAAPYRHPSADAAEPLRARVLGRPIPRGRRRTSYSSLTADRRADARAAATFGGGEGDSGDVTAAEERALAADETLRDHDAATAWTDDAGRAPDTMADAHRVDAHRVDAHRVDAHRADALRIDAHQADVHQADAQGAAPVTLHAFPAGADPGTCLHAILERIDFTTDTGWPAAIADACRRAGLANAAEPLPAALAELVATPLADGPAAFTLADVQRGQRVNEMAFVLPVAVDEQGAIRGDALQPRDLAAAFAADGATGLPDGYPAAVGALGFEAVRGHLGGFIDMVFRRGERWYIVDWKSNRLGPTWDDYTPEAIVKTMAHHHYYVQYHLYTVALHRYLAKRVPEYAYDTHFGGVFYLFIRGMHPRLGPSRGVFFDRPPAERIARLDAVLYGSHEHGVRDDGSSERPTERSTGR